MAYHEAANFLFDLRRFRLRPGTESTADLLAVLGDPHEGTPTVQVAGSNGKGSTARMTESVLREAGYSVGLYTSPHLDDLRERIRVDGRKIPKGAVADFVGEVREYVTDRAADGDAPTFFEALTAMALWQFDRADVDVAVLEVGIGGRYDATSVVDPAAAAVTSVSLEHTDLLGDTVGEIARDKAHVAPADAPLATGATGEALDGIREVAGEVVTVGPGDRSDVAAGDRGDDRGADAGGSPDVRTTYGGRTDTVEAAVAIEGDGWSVDARVPLIGAVQAVNAGLAATLARQVDARVRGPAAVDADVEADAHAGGAPGVTERAIERGLRKAHWPGRFEVMETGPTVVLDGAHNPGACERLAATLGEFEYGALHVAFGALHDKDHREMAAALPTPDRLLACAPDSSRAADPAVLATVFRDAGAETVLERSDVRGAVEEAVAGADEGDLVLVTGSLYTVAEARRRWIRREVPKRVESVETARAVLADADVPDEVARRTAGDAVHRVVETRLRPPEARLVRERLLSIGGECAVSEVGDGQEPVDAVLTGTLAQFAELVDDLEAGPPGRAALGRQLRRVLGPELDAAVDSGDATAESGDAVADSGAAADSDDSDDGQRPGGPGDGEKGDSSADGAEYPWEDGTAIMGILNITPDSFHDGGEYDRLEAAVERAERQLAAGAEILDVGGESTRPGADPVPVEEEIDRVVPVIERLAELDATVSVDTRKAEVARAALAAGADVINDVSGLSDPEMRFVAAEHDVPIVVMHSVETPVDPDSNPTYDDVVEDVIAELGERIRLAEQAGLDRSKIVVDPGLGFGKAARESFELLDRLGELRALGCPVMVGHSHKSMFGLAGGEAGDALDETIAATALAADRGADVVRVHDVAENVAAVRTALAARDPDAFEG